MPCIRRGYTHRFKHTTPHTTTGATYRDASVLRVLLTTLHFLHTTNAILIGYTARAAPTNTWFGLRSTTAIALKDVTAPLARVMYGTVEFSRTVVDLQRDYLQPGGVR